MRWTTECRATLSLLLIFSISSGTGGQEPTGGFHPGRQTPIVQRSGQITARMEKTGAQLRVSLERQDKVFATIELPQELAQVDSISFVANDKIVVLGHVNGSVRQVVVIEAARQSIIDKFYCYEPVGSPNRRFLAFIKFYPPHFVPGVSDQYLLYDFEKSPEANRPRNVPLSDPQNVGQVLYPRTAKNQFGDNTEQPVSKIHMLASGTFFWSAEGDRVTFADTHLGIVRLVVARLQGVKPDLEVTERELRKSDICNSQQDLDSCSFAVSSMEFTDDVVKLTLRPLNFAVGIKTEIKVKP